MSWVIGLINVHCTAFIMACVIHYEMLFNKWGEIQEKRIQKIINQDTNYFKRMEELLRV